MLLLHRLCHTVLCKSKKQTCTWNRDDGNTDCFLRFSLMASSPVPFFFFFLLVDGSLQMHLRANQALPKQQHLVHQMGHLKFQESSSWPARCSGDAASPPDLHAACSGLEAPEPAPREARSPGSTSRRITALSLLASLQLVGQNEWGPAYKPDKGCIRGTRLLYQAPALWGCLEAAPRLHNSLLLFQSPSSY